MDVSPIEPGAEPPPSPLDNPSCLPDPAYHTAVVHFYRAEMNRMTVWRRRLDTTTNWAILLTTGMTTFTLGTVSVPHYVLLLGLAIIGFCLFIEARRFQHLHHSKWRLSLLERCYFGELLDPGRGEVESSWRRILSADLRQPHYTIDWPLAARIRLRRNYLMLVYFSTGVWITKLYIHPTDIENASDFYGRLAVGSLIPSWIVAATAVLFVGGATLLAVLTPSQEQLEEWTFDQHSARH